MNDVDFRRLTEQAQSAFVAGRTDEAVELFQTAEALARDAGREDLVDRAFCSRCAVLVELEAVAEHVAELKKILLRSRDQKTRWMAAYYTAVAYDLDEDRDQAYGFARRALDVADELGEAGSTAATANLLGNLALVQCHFDEAESAYRRALDHYRQLGGYRRLMAAQVLDNLGYTMLCTERIAEGVKMCEDSRDAMRSLGATHYLHQPLQDLCYGYLLQDRFDNAVSSGEEGLELALALEDRLVVKNLLFLLAEVSVRRGDRFGARRYLHELMQWYPETGPSEEMVELLLAMDLTHVVNLRG